MSRRSLRARWSLWLCRHAALRGIARGCHPLVDDGSHGERTLVLQGAKSHSDVARSQCTARRGHPRREISPHSPKFSGKIGGNGSAVPDGPARSLPPSARSDRSWSCPRAPVRDPGGRSSALRPGFRSASTRPCTWCNVWTRSRRASSITGGDPAVDASWWFSLMVG